MTTVHVRYPLYNQELHESQGWIPWIRSLHAFGIGKDGISLFLFSIIIIYSSIHLSFHPLIFPSSQQLIFNWSQTNRAWMECMQKGKLFKIIRRVLWNMSNIFSHLSQTGAFEKLRSTNSTMIALFHCCSQTMVIYHNGAWCH